MTDIYDRMKSLYEGEGQQRLVLIIIVALVAVWLWVSWLYSWFPFAASPVTSPTTAQTQEDILRSLTPTVSTTSDPSRTAAILKTLTPTSKTATKKSAADTAAILDSLTPKK